LFRLEKISFGYYGEKILPAWMARLIGKGMRSAYLRYASRTTQSVMDKLFTDDKLKAILTAQYGDYGLSPAHSSFAMHAVVARHYMEGGYYPEGGSAALFRKIAPVIRKAGGEIVVRAEVRHILVERGRAAGVEMADGKEIRANMVISTIGVQPTYERLLHYPVQQRYKLADKIKDLKYTTSYCCLYLGLEHTAEELDLPRANSWIFPPVYDHEKNQADFASGNTENFPVVYISFPAAKDPSFAKRHPGKSTIEIITLADYSAFSQWADTPWMHRPPEYNELKEKISAQLLECLYHYLPQLKGKIAYHELSTPLSAAHFLGRKYGETYGLDFTPERFENSALRTFTPVKGLYLAGQDIVTAGVGGGLMSAVLCASSILRTNYAARIQRRMKIAGRQAWQKAKEQPQPGWQPVPVTR
jgi:all-trans-retinol 13,14-reductase